MKRLHIGARQARHLRRISARRRSVRAKVAIERMPQPSQRSAARVKARERMIEEIKKQRESNNVQA